MCCTSVDCNVRQLVKTTGHLRHCIHLRVIAFFQQPAIGLKLHGRHSLATAELLVLLRPLNILAVVLLLLSQQREREYLFAKNINTILSYNTKQCRRATKKAIAHQRWPPIVTISNQ